jgi:peptidoglycan/xylan/chitin deacetylase (PgdA/CDA1 family)
VGREDFRPDSRRAARRLARTLAQPFLRALGAPVSGLVERALRLTGRRVGVALIYHSVEPVQGDLDRQIVPPHGSELFAAHVRHLMRRYRVVSAGRLPDAVANRRRGERFPVAITFDDDLACHLDVVLPILTHAGASATFFLTGAALERPYAFWWERLQRAVDRGLELPAVGNGRRIDLTRPGAIHEVGKVVETLTPPEREAFSAALLKRLGDDPPTAGLRAEGVAELVSAGMEIGFHTLRHDSLLSLDDESLQVALTDGRAALDELAGGRLTVVAYPHGHFDDRVAAAARAAGFDYGYTTRVEPVLPGSDPLQLGRLGPSYRSAGHFAVQLVRLLARRAHQ